MRFGLVHRVMTNALASLGVLALVSSGELGKWVNLAIVVGLIAGLSVPETWHQKVWLNRAATVGPVVLLVAQVARFFLTGKPLLDLAVEFAAALQVVRLATRRGAAHDQQVIVLALIHLIAGTVLGSGLGYGLCFLGFVAVAPGALVLSHLRREVEGNYRQGARDRTGLPVDVPRILRSRRVVGRSFLLVMSSLAVPILLFTGLLFLIFPRVGLSFLLLNPARGGLKISYSDKVDLGSVGKLRDDPSIALRIDIPDLPTPPPDRVTLYLRGTALDAFDPRGVWARTNVDRKPALRDRTMIYIERPPEKATDRLLKIDREPFDPPVLFIPPGAVAMEVRSRAEATLIGSGQLQIDRGPEGEFRYRSQDERGMHYEVYVARNPTPLNVPLTREDRARYLALPQLPDRIGELAQRWVAGKNTPQEKARAIEDHLRTEFRYDTSNPSGGTALPLDHFLFESRRGHCEFYSTAMAVMLRQVGVPSRNVTGLLGGEYNRFSRNYIVRQRESHSWVEAYIDGAGWLTFDPTPPADAAPKNEVRGAFALLRDIIEASSQRWDRHVVGYNISQQISLLQQFRSLTRGTNQSLPASLQGRGALVGVALLLIGAGVAAYLLRNKRWRRPTRPTRPGAQRNQQAGEAAQLYEQLDAALTQQGLSRPQGTPPLRHALSPQVKAHALGPEIEQLTRIYLDIRFGGAQLSEEERRAVEQRIKLLRTYKPPRASASRLLTAPAK
jgi:transglutaminase-like putative cysteine protease